MPVRLSMPTQTTGFEASPQPRRDAGRLRRLGIDTGHELVVYLNKDSPICRSEGFGAHARLDLRVGERRVMATLNIVQNGLLGVDEVGLSESAWLALLPGADERVIIAHPPGVSPGFQKNPGA